MELKYGEKKYRKSKQHSDSAEEEKKNSIETLLFFPLLREKQVKRKKILIKIKADILSILSINTGRNNLVRVN